VEALSAILCYPNRGAYVAKSRDLPHGAKQRRRCKTPYTSRPAGPILSLDSAAETATLRGSRNFGEQTMTTFKLAVAGLVLGLSAVLPVRAQVTVDISKITCEQYILYKITDPDRIIFWLSGYYNGKRDNTIIDTHSFEDNVNKVKNYCRANFKATLMQAAEKLFANQ
jgi:acid stress chaperone HdeB